MSVPPLPSVDHELLGRYDAAHAGLASALASAAPEARRAFTHLQRRILVESLAYVQPVLADATGPLVVPPPRAFLNDRQQLRIAGAASAFRHLDSRVAMQRAGWVPCVVEHSTPLALHALLEGTLPSGRETNAGMFRVTPTAWRPEANAFAHPPAEHCPALVAEAIDTATMSSAPACVRAAWLTFTMLSIHPFVDGNGRTSRALCVGVAAEHLEVGVDWGILEQWSIARPDYVDALQAGQQLDAYDGARLDAGPFVSFTTARSAAGAQLCRRRLERVEADLFAWGRLGLSAEATLVATVVRHSVFAGVEELVELGIDASGLDAALGELVGAGLLAWCPRPASRRTRTSVGDHGLVVAAHGSS